MRSRVVVTVIAAVGVLSGCSSKPRNFAPVLGTAPVDQAQFQQQWLTCRDQAAASIKAGHGRGASAAAGVAAGAGGAAAVGAATAGTYATYGAAAAALGATIIAAPLAAIGGAWGISKIKKTKKERAIKAATAECLAKAGYPVEKWRVMKKQEVRALPPVPAPPATPAAQTSASEPASAGTPDGKPQ